MWPFVKMCFPVLYPHPNSNRTSLSKIRASIIIDKEISDKAAAAHVGGEYNLVSIIICMLTLTQIVKKIEITVD